MGFFARNLQAIEPTLENHPLVERNRSKVRIVT
jgi:hypothetical protein